MCRELERKDAASDRVLPVCGWRRLHGWSGAGGGKCGACGGGGQGHCARDAANFPDHEVRVQTLGDTDDLEALAAELASRDRQLHLHGSPPCVRLSQVNQTNRDAEEGLRLVRWYLDLVERVRPRTFSMERCRTPPSRRCCTSEGSPSRSWTR